jgi:hypothetical protein
LISNIDLEQREKVFDVIARAILVLKALPREATDEEVQKAFAPLVGPLLGVSKCPDFVGQPRSLFWYRVLQRGAGFERSRQAGAGRISQDAVSSRLANRFFAR